MSTTRPRLADTSPPEALVLGPLLRYVDETTASVWVETKGAATVRVVAGDCQASSRTFIVHGHHYALVCLTGLPVGSQTPYEVFINDELVWPPPSDEHPPPVIATLDPERPLRLAFGSCRTSVTHDKAGNSTHGIDALRAYGLRLAGFTDATALDDPDPDDEVRWPDLLLFLGDQVYADETTKQMQEFISSRRNIEEPPGEELKDFEEYAHLYWLAWTEPTNRWLLSTLPSAMIFDDHDVRDDWNTSLAWKHKMEATQWWHGRIVAALASYWVYQHLGNLSPTALASEPIWTAICDHQDSGREGEFDASDLLDSFAERVDQDPQAYRWSFAREYSDTVRLIVVDSRAARVLESESRSMLDPDEMAWLNGQLRGDVDHLLVGTSLPFMLAPGLHKAEAFSEALAEGAWGARGQRVGESLRQHVDLEHWGAFQDAFIKVSDMVLAVARGERGRAPGTVTFLSGDVHHSYVSEAWPSRARPGVEPNSRILQAVCSPIRNPLGKPFRFVLAALAYGVAPVVGRLTNWTSKVPEQPLRWKLIDGPWFDNLLATLEVEGRELRIWWATGEGNLDEELPRLRLVGEFHTGHE